MTTILMPPTTKTFGAQALAVFATEPANPKAATTVEATAAENITCHIIGSWWPTASTDKASRARKMCQTKVTQSLGTTTWDVPDLQYTMNPQTVGTPGSAGNEAYEALPEGAVVYLALRTGISGRTSFGSGDAYQLLGVELGPQVRSQSADDAGGEATVTQTISILEEYADGPVDGVVAA